MEPNYGFIRTSTDHVVVYRRVRNMDVNGMERGVYRLSCSCGWTDEVVGWTAMVDANQAHKLHGESPQSPDPR